MRKEAHFDRYNCYEFLRKGGAVQASEQAILEFQKLVESVALEIAKRACLFADDEARRKVLPSDVKKGFEEFLSSL
ncbi:MAG: hypothetical protein ACYCQJ_01835 [Nitrososphaerales archaeon]